jgi:hypothetical protein
MNNNNKKQSAIDRFLKSSEPVRIKESKKFIQEFDGLIIERIDKVLITKDGKQLLREHY